MFCRMMDTLISRERMTARKLVKLVRQGHVAELVHEEMNVNGEPAAVLEIRQVEQLLEQLGIEHPDQEIEAAVIVGQDGEQHPFRSPRAGRFSSS